MSAHGQQQTVPRTILEERVGRKLGLRDTFITKTGTWQVIDINVDQNDADLLVVEKID